MTEIIGPGICDFCEKDADQLMVIKSKPMAGVCSCRECAGLTDSDPAWIQSAEKEVQP